MVPILLSLTLFAALWLVGLGLFAALGADLASLRVALSAPVLGSAATIVPLFLASCAGISMRYGGPVVVTALLVGSIVLLVKRRPRLPQGTTPVIAACVGAAFLSAWPFLRFGFSWIANTNGDMTLYVLSATRLLHHGLLSGVDRAAISGDRNFAELLNSVYGHGGRPGSDIALAALSSLIGRPPYQVYMSLGVALNLVTTCGVAALAMQATRRRWAALVAATLYAVAPLATYGLVQQLLPQVWGLGLACGLLALVMRRDLHQAGGARIRDVIPIGVMTAALVVVYMELASILVLAYVLYVFILVGRRQIALTAVFIRLWLPALAIVLIVLNSYALRDAHYVKLQVTHGTQPAGSPPTFGYALVPSALAAVVGLQRWNASSTAPIVGVSIVVAAIILAAVLFGVGATFWRGQAASIALAASVLLAAVLAARVSDFGLFKLAMDIQPLLAAAIAVWLSMLSRRFLVPAAAVVALVAVVQLSVQFQYVQRSVNPVDLPDASAPGLMPTFERYFHRSARPVISVADNPVLVALEASVAGPRALYFISNNVFGANVYGTKWKKRTFKLSDGPGGTTTFQDNEPASALLRTGRCNLVLPTGTQSIVNRRELPDGSPDLVFRDCKTVRDTLVFTESDHGTGFYSFSTNKKDITLFQLEPDYFYPGQTFSGVGRYLLFRVLRPEREARLEIWITTTVRAPSVNLLPPASVVGARRWLFPIVGRGSARVFSSPLKPQVIGGQPYVMLDLGRDGTLTAIKRALVQGLFGGNVDIDPRYLTAYVRDISLVGGSAYRKLAAPTSVQHFPGDLANEGLEYSGIYEDGWVAGDSYVVLAAGPADTLSVKANVLPVKGQHLDVLVNGRRVVSQNVAPGPLAIRVPLAHSTIRRRVELRWARTIQLGPLDHRQAAAQLQFVGTGVPSP